MKKKGLSKSELLQEMYDTEDTIERLGLFDYERRNTVIAVLASVTKRIAKLNSLE